MRTSVKDRLTDIDMRIHFPGQNRCNFCRMDLKHTRYFPHIGIQSFPQCQCIHSPSGTGRTRIRLCSARTSSRWSLSHIRRRRNPDCWYTIHGFDMGNLNRKHHQLKRSERTSHWLVTLGGAPAIKSTNLWEIILWIAMLVQSCEAEHKSIKVLRNSIRTPGGVMKVNCKRRFLIFSSWSNHVWARWLF